MDSTSLTTGFDIWNLALIVGLIGLIGQIGLIGLVGRIGLIATHANRLCARKTFENQCKTASEQA